MALFTLRFINDEDLVGRAIDWVTDSLWDHVEIMTDTGTWIGAHSAGGVEERAANYCTPSRERVYALDITEAQHDATLSFARSKIGTAYDYADIAGLFLHDRRLDQRSRYICSMFVYEAALAGGIEMLNVLPGWTYLITPETLHLSPLLIGKSTHL